MAAATDHQMRAAMSGSPTSTQAPAARVSIPLALRSANQSASRITWNIVPRQSTDATHAAIRGHGRRTRHAAFALRETSRPGRLRNASAPGATGQPERASARTACSGPASGRALLLSPGPRGAAGSRNRVAGAAAPRAAGRVPCHEGRRGGLNGRTHALTQLQARRSAPARPLRAHGGVSGSLAEARSSRKTGRTQSVSYRAAFVLAAIVPFCGHCETRPA